MRVVLSAALVPAAQSTLGAKLPAQEIAARKPVTTDTGLLGP